MSLPLQQCFVIGLKRGLTWVYSESSEKAVMKDPTSGVLSVIPVAVEGPCINQSHALMTLLAINTQNWGSDYSFAWCTEHSNRSLIAAAG